MTEKDTKAFQWRKYLEACLQSTDYCALATVDPKGVWSNPVYFAYDNEFNLYFISMPRSRHMKNIAKDPRVSVSIYSTNQDTHGDVNGMYVEGRAEFIPDGEVLAAHKIYYDRVHPNGHNEKSEQHMGENAKWKFVKIIPEHLYYFDTRFFGEERQEAPLEDLRKR